uniref:Uncharacterized protein n=1 Tax=Rhizophora mucronata TaxID=61149 RepID=A0A2P2Q3C2_RHIMU
MVHWFMSQWPVHFRVFGFLQFIPYLVE